jgi:hypothetical protein
MSAHRHQGRDSLQGASGQVEVLNLQRVNSSKTHQFLDPFILSVMCATNKS